MDKHTETERRFLIAMPDISALDNLENCKKVNIVQTYLSVREGFTDRVRLSESAGKSIYTRTTKSRISAMSNIEDEREISEDEYNSLLKFADKSRRAIHKTRYKISSGNLIYEIDIYPFWRKQAVMEVELESEEQPVPPLKGIRVLRELTGIREYGNAALSYRIPDEDE